MIRVLLVCLALLGLAACETAKGANRDLQKAGDAINGMVKKVEKKL
ncbi:hypothetical protein [Albibacillus kandeliae]|mgnify:CR=1 FL=1|jgi:entericidin B|nr:hypothetical protein [Albibacillus kandeliae]